jgi:hypothetical protein
MYTTSSIPHSPLPIILYFVSISIKHYFISLFFIITRLHSVQCTVQWNSSISETVRNRTHVHCLEWPKLWHPRILTFLPGTLCIVWDGAFVMKLLFAGNEILQAASWGTVSFSRISLIRGVSCACKILRSVQWNRCTAETVRNRTHLHIHSFA